MTSFDVRKKYLAFFENREHTILPSALLVPENDPTTLFTGSGMQPLLPYLLGEKHPRGTRLVDSQKCFRAEDIDEVGDNRHTTFFEMLGNWSLGSYWKEEQLSWFFKFLTEELSISPERLWVTCFEGDEALGIPRDAESAATWERLGISKEHIRFYGAKKNWWSRAGTPHDMPVGEPGGPDSETFFEFTGVPHDPAYEEKCHPNCDCGRFMEIGNSVFMQYVKKQDGSFGELPQKNVDFGGGLERITAAANDNPDVFGVDSLQSIVRELEEHTGKSYHDPEFQTAFRVIADHMRAAIFIIGDNVLPSNTEQGYFVRRLIRRSVMKARFLSSTPHFFALGTLAHTVARMYKETYPILYERVDFIDATITNEETKFRQTIEYGLKIFEKLNTTGISGHDAFILFSTYGFPFELTLELAKEKGISVDTLGFKSEMKKHQELSRKGAQQKFKGGLADTSDMSVKYHTTTHLLQQALREVLGNHVYQKGSNITPERLRFDFSHGEKMTDEEKKKVEEIVNQKIKDALPVSFEDIPITEAQKRGAIGLFEEKYGDRVRVYSIGDPSVDSGQVFSMEYCGGPHVKNTSELGENDVLFKIVKEEAVSAGIRRIKAKLI